MREETKDAEGDNDYSKTLANPLSQTNSQPSISMGRLQLANSLPTSQQKNLASVLDMNDNQLDNYKGKNALKSKGILFLILMLILEEITQ
jgi:hypothetical protein